MLDSVFELEYLYNEAYDPMMNAENWNDLFYGTEIDELEDDVA